MAKRPSMSDVARHAGVSAQTVSRVSNGAPYVSKEKRERVLAAMRELGYRPNSAARAMKSGMFRTIGVIYESLHPVGNHRTLEAISEIAAHKGYTITLMPLDAETRNAADGAFTRLGEMLIDAAIAIVPSDFYHQPGWKLPADLPSVILGPPIFSDVSTVDFDQSIGTRQAVNTLLDLGHDTVYHIAGPQESYSARSREATWRDTLTQRARKVVPPLHGDWTPDSGYTLGRTLLDESQPTAVFVANDQMALGLYRAVIEKGLRIPDDISVIGFDNIDESSAFPPPLTTVAQDWERIGKEALSSVLKLLDGESPGRTVLPTALIERESCAPPPREEEALRHL